MYTWGWRSTCMYMPLSCTDSTETRFPWPYSFRESLISIIFLTLDSFEKRCVYIQCSRGAGNELLRVLTHTTQLPNHQCRRQMGSNSLAAFLWRRKCLTVQLKMDWRAFTWWGGVSWSVRHSQGLWLVSLASWKADLPPTAGMYLPVNYYQAIS